MAEESRENEIIAFQQVDDLLAQNQEMLSALYKIAAVSESAEETVKKFADDFAEVEANRAFVRDAQHLREVLASYGEDIDISLFFAERILLSMSLSDIEEIYQEYLEEHGHKRSFREAVLEGPENPLEEQLVMAATAFLEPADFKEAVTSGASLIDVASMINNSVVKRFTDQVIENIGHDKVEDAISHAAEEQVNPLSVQFGIVDMVQHSLEETGIAIRQNHQERSSEHEISR
jgi:hypothetical protein